MIYFDNSATTKPYPEVLESFTKVSTSLYGNPSSLHKMGAKAEQLLSQARSQIAQLMNVKPNEVYFTSGGTESNNLAIKGITLKYSNRGKHIISTEIEHPSVKESLEQLKTFGFSITYVPVNKQGFVCVEDFKQAITNETFLVSVMHVNNEIGSIQPIQQIGTLLEDYPQIYFHVDHVQGIGKVPINMKDCRIDLCSISGHKFHGLKGTGALYVREGVQLSPILTGGNQEFKYRSGTENVAGMVAMAKALRITMEKRQTKQEKMLEINRFLRSELESLDGVVLHTPLEHAAPHILNFSVIGIKSEVLVHALGEKDCFVSTTSACSSKRKLISKTLLAMGIPEQIAASSIRISLSYENTFNEAIVAMNAIKEAIVNLRKVMK